jgi:hypothetical protein
VTITVPSRPGRGPGTPVAARAHEVWKVYGNGEVGFVFQQPESRHDPAKG